MTAKKSMSDHSYRELVVLKYQVSLGSKEDKNKVLLDQVCDMSMPYLGRNLPRQEW